MRLFHPDATEWQTLRKPVKGEDGETTWVDTDARFEIGFIPRGVLTPIRAEMAVAHARRERMEAAAKERGTRPPTDAEAREHVEVDAGYNRLYREAVRWGVRGHDGLIDDQGKPIPFETGTVTRLGQQVPVVADRILDLYEQTEPLMALLASMVLTHQGLPAVTLSKS